MVFLGLVWIGFGHFHQASAWLSHRTGFFDAMIPQHDDALHRYSTLFFMLLCGTRLAFRHTRDARGCCRSTSFRTVPPPSCVTCRLRANDEASSHSHRNRLERYQLQARLSMYAMRQATIACMMSVILRDAVHDFQGTDLEASDPGLCAAILHDERKITGRQRAAWRFGRRNDGEDQLL